VVESTEQQRLQFRIVVCWMSVVMGSFERTPLLSFGVLDAGLRCIPYLYSTSLSLLLKKNEGVPFSTFVAFRSSNILAFGIIQRRHVGQYITPPTT
jgi:hypothetical protein